jgi:hypothetical protein
LVDAYGDYNSFGEVSFFLSCRRFQKEKRAAIKFCVKLQKTATETFEMMKSVYGEECLLRTSVFEWHKRFKEGRELLQDDEWKITGETMLSVFFDAKAIVHHKFVLRKTDCKQQIFKKI